MSRIDGKKLKRQEAEYLIDQIGQEDEKKGAKATLEYAKIQEKKEIEREDRSTQMLHDLRKNKIKYNLFITNLLTRFLQGEDIPGKYRIDVVANKTGVVVSIRGTNYVEAFRTCGVPKFDIFAAKTKAIRVGNTVAHLEGIREKVGNVVIPDAGDLKKYAGE